MKQTELELLNKIVQRHGLHVYCECGECRVRHAPLPKLGFVAIAGTNESEFAQRVLERFVENEKEKRMDNDIGSLVRQYRAQKTHIDKLKAELDDLRTDIFSAVIHGEPYKDEIGYARVRQPSTRASYRAKDLDVLLNTQDERYAFLDKYRTERTTRATLAIK